MVITILGMVADIAGASTIVITNYGPGAYGSDDATRIREAYVKRNKTDAADAEAICEAVTRPTMRYVPTKTQDEQAAGMVLKARDLLIRQRTQAINALRAHLAELGIVRATGLVGIISLAATNRSRMRATILQRV